MEKCRSNETELFKAMVNSRAVTLLDHPVAFHCDVPRKKVQIEGDYSFIEFKFVFVDSQANVLSKNCDGCVRLARIIGGTEECVAVTGVASHG